jgi:hypothetical protein
MPNISQSTYLISKRPRRSIIRGFAPYFPYLIIIPFYLAIIVPGYPVISIIRLIIAILLGSFLLLYSPINALEKIWTLKFNRLLIVGYLILPLIALPNSSDVLKSVLSILGERFLFIPFFFSMGYYYLSNRDSLKTFISSITYATIVIMIIGIIEFYYGFNIVTHIVQSFTSISIDDFEKYSLKESNIDEESIFRSNRATATFRHGISFGVFVASFSNIFIFNILSRNKYVSKTINIIGLCLMPFALYASGSRTPLLLLMLILYINRAILLDVKSNISKYVIVGFLIFVLFQIYAQFYRIEYGFGNDMGRLIMIEDLISYLGDFKIIGIGISMFSRSNGVLWNSFRIIDPMAFSLTMIIEIGISYIPFIIVLTIYIRRINKTIQASHNYSGYERYFSQFVYSIFIANILISFISISLFNVSHIGTAMLWMMIGIVHSIRDHSLAET